MSFKRLEIYVGWTCNQKCTYCMEFHNMVKNWSKKVTKYYILKKLLKYKMLGYNHVTFLGGEPFIQGVFYDALILGKKLGYTILVTTNATTLHIDSQASKFLPYIDELFLSVEAISIEDQQLISRTKNYVHWDNVFENIKKYWKGTLLKVNIVITQDNKDKLFDIVKFVSDKGIKNIAVTYPDIDIHFYGRKHILSRVAPKYSECIDEIIKIVNFCEINNINIKIVDFPFCIFPRDNIEKYVKLTDDYDYSPRLKIDYKGKEQNRIDFIKVDDMPRERNNSYKCKECFYNKLCWGHSRWYKLLYGLDEITPIIKN